MEEKETEDFYKDIAKDVETRFDTSGYSKDDNRFFILEGTRKPYT